MDSADRPGRGLRDLISGCALAAGVLVLANAARAALIPDEVPELPIAARQNERGGEANHRARG